MSTTPMNQDVQGCILDCQDCHRICLDTLQHCLQMGGKHAEAEHIQALLDCAEICATTANFMLRASALQTRLAAACAEACARCADSCDGAGSTGKMKACADMCRRCAISCQRMANPEVIATTRKAA